MNIIIKFETKMYIETAKHLMQAYIRWNYKDISAAIY